MLWLFLASRETAFVYAITSSGVVHEVTKACSRGLLRECVCNNTQHQGRNGRGFQWGGCNDSIEHGLKYASEFIDSREKEQDVRAKINLHNNFVGRHVSTSSNTPFHVFSSFEIRQHGWKERLKISKAAKFESDLLKTYGDTAPQRSEILQTFCMMGARSRTHHTNVSKISRLYEAISSLVLNVSPLNLVRHPIFRFFFQ